MSRDRTRHRTGRAWGHVGQTVAKGGGSSKDLENDGQCVDAVARTQTPASSPAPVESAMTTRL